MKVFYPLLNAFFHLLHISIICFALLGWIFPQSRQAHFVFMLAMLGSWFILGKWMGEGYCPITDWHWKIKDAFGEGRPEGPYIHFLATRLSGLKLSSQKVDRIVVAVTFLITAISAALNLAAWMRIAS